MTRRCRLLALIAGLLCAVIVADRLNPPNMSRAVSLSREVVARDGTPLRTFLSRDGAWRIRTTPDQVNPRYVAMLKAYEDRRFDRHWGIDPSAPG